MRRTEEGFGKQNNISGVQLDWEILGKVAVNPNSNKELNIEINKTVCDNYPKEFTKNVIKPDPNVETRERMCVLSDLKMTL